MKIKEVLKNFGMKNAEAQVSPQPLSGPRLAYEPKPPAKILEKMKQANKSV